MVGLEEVVPNLLEMQAGRLWCCPVCPTYVNTLRWTSRAAGGRRRAAPSCMRTPWRPTERHSTWSSTPRPPSINRLYCFTLIPFFRGPQPPGYGQAPIPGKVGTHAAQQEVSSHGKAKLFHLHLQPHPSLSPNSNYSLSSAFYQISGDIINII